MQNQKSDCSSSIPVVTTRTIIDDFFESCTIHAVKEAKRSNNKPTLIFWIIVMVGCFGGVSYEIYQIVDDYNDHPGVTQVSWTSHITYKYPPMAFCPKRWLNWRRAKEMRLSEEEIAYVFSLVNIDTEMDGDFHEPHVRGELDANMKRYNITDFAELLKRISFEPNEILRVLSSPGNVSFRPIVQSYGVCYLIDVDPIKSVTLRTNVMLRLDYMAPRVAMRGGRPEEDTIKYDGRWQPRLLLQGANGLKANFISLSKKAIYIINLDAEVYKKMSRREKLCLSDEETAKIKVPPQGSGEYNAALCEFLCVEKERLRRSCDHCTNIAVIETMRLTNRTRHIEPCFYHKLKIMDEEFNDTFQFQSGADIHLSSFDSPATCSSEAMARVKDACSTDCPPPCTQWHFKYSASILTEDLANGRIILWIAYNPVDGVILYEEVPSYTLDTLISNVGGQLGLWLGASIISTVQIIYYILKVLCYQKFRRASMRVEKEIRILQLVTPGNLLSTISRRLPTVASECTVTDLC